MCRFLIVKSKEDFDPRPLLREFSLACQKSRTPEGDWQGDGWGVSWITEGGWRIYKSLSPAWKDNQTPAIPRTKLLVVHARSASFPGQKGNLNFNQPYIEDGTCFIFNGLLRKVRLDVPGEIGAQKIWWLLRKQGKGLSRSLRETKELLYENSESIRGLNMALVRDGEVSVLCDYSEDKEYFTLWYGRHNGSLVVCSLQLPGYNLKPMKKGVVNF